ncbi:MAG TPA: cell division protein FtsZ [Chthoniobacterales bacterium]|jgi:cell division protein FtsZ|nr:cell division protein FtsZ [Chthoniobacterales bacterium]
MIQLSKNYSLPERQEEPIPIKVVGVGSAGSNVLDRVLLDGMDKADLIAVNTDVQSLASSVAARKVQLGRTCTRGLGTGGDPELGYQAAIESADEIRQAIAGPRMIFICAGLGGGTGSGAAPIVAQLAREAGSLVIAFATLPFSFEGKRRAVQAQDALSRLNEIANAVICFENDRMGDMVAPKAGIHQAFGVADMTISQSVRSIVNLIQRPGLIRIGFDDLFAALRSQNGRCLFGFGESDSDNRAHDALTQALKNPLMDKGRMLSEAAHVLVQVAGGPGMTLSEVEILMRELGRHVRDHTQIVFGTAVDGRMGNRLSVTIISSLASEDSMVAQQMPAQPEPFLAPPPPVLEQAEEPPPAPPKIDIVPEHEIAPSSEPAAGDLIAFEPPAAAEAPPPAPVPSIKKPAPRLIPPKKKPVVEKEAKPPKEKSVQAKQEVLQFEPVTRGRFEKSEPTIVEGQDLDIPTFLRKNIRVK